MYLQHSEYLAFYINQTMKLLYGLRQKDWTDTAFDWT